VNYYLRNDEKGESMDIIVRGKEYMTDYDMLKGLTGTTEGWIWRGPHRPQCNDGDRVYFHKNQTVAGYCFYKGFDYRKSKNVEGKEQAGMAIVLKGPFSEFRNPVPCDLPGRWLWCYVTRIPGLSVSLARAR